MNRTHGGLCSERLVAAATDGPRTRRTPRRGPFRSPVAARTLDQVGGPGHSVPGNQTGTTERRHVMISKAATQDEVRLYFTDGRVGVSRIPQAWIPLAWHDELWARHGLRLGNDQSIHALAWKIELWEAGSRYADLTTTAATCGYSEGWDAARRALAAHVMPTHTAN